jgi:anti-repressor protein
METLVIMKDQQALTTSLQVAEVFKKEHSKVMRSIENIRQAKNGESVVDELFVKSSYRNLQNHEQPMYYINRDGFTLLAMGFTGKKAMEFKLKYIEAFNSMEAQIRNYGGFQIPSSMSEALQLAANQAKQMEIMKPKAVFADAVAASHTSILVSELAKILKQNGIDMGGTRLFEWLRTNGYLISRKGTDWNIPTQKSMNLGLFEVKERTIDHGDHTTISKTTKVTGKGQQYFVNKFLK